MARPTTIKPDLVLEDYQKDMIRAQIKRKRSLVTGGTGTGKTCVEIYSFAYLKDKGHMNNLFVLTPLSAYVKKVWPKDIAKFSTLKCIDLETLNERVSNSYQRLEHLLANYDIIYGKHSHLKQMGPLIRRIVKSPKMGVCIDEVHKFKSQSSLQSATAKLWITNPYTMWGMTATPLSKNLEDTYHILSFIKPLFLGTFQQFKKTWCKTKEKVIGRLPGGGLKKAEDIVGIIDEKAWHDKISEIVIPGPERVPPNFHFVTYEMTEEEALIYKTIANGIDIDDGVSNEEWISKVLEDLSERDVPERKLKEVNRHSSRFIYLQTAADGVISRQGTQDRMGGTKVTMFANLVKGIVEKKQSCLVYFDYLSSLDVFHKTLKEMKLDAKILLSTGQNVLEDGTVTEGKVKAKPHIILCTRAASESESYYFMNHVVLFHNPTIPITFVQMIGRITRMNTLFPGDLHVYLSETPNIDLYKLYVASSKSYQMELVSGPEANIPNKYKKVALQPNSAG